MGTDQIILVAWGFRVPIAQWEEFKEGLRRFEQSTKRRVVDKERGDSYDIIEYDADYELERFESGEAGDSTSGTVHGFVSQDNIGDSGYVLIYDSQQEVTHLMNRKIGGALAWTCKGFKHMQSIDTLTFSVQLERTVGKDELARSKSDFIARLPDRFREFMATLPVEVHYNRWLFSYVC